MNDYEEDLDPLEIILDAGSKYILAGVKGDEEEAQRQMERGCAAYAAATAQNARDKEIVEAFTGLVQPPVKKKQRKKPQQSKLLTQNLGGLLEAALAKKEK